MQKGFGVIYILVGILVLTMVGVGGFYLGQQKSKSPPQNQPDEIACTQDAKECPDGSFVGRTGPNCEFAVCPADASGAPNRAGETTNMEQNKGYICSPTYPIETGMVELTASANYSRECYKQTTLVDCQKVDIYNENTQDFVTEDGKSDCEWIPR